MLSPTLISTCWGHKSTTLLHHRDHGCCKRGRRGDAADQCDDCDPASTVHDEDPGHHRATIRRCMGASKAMSPAPRIQHRDAGLLHGRLQVLGDGVELRAVEVSARLCARRPSSGHGKRMAPSPAPDGSCRPVGTSRRSRLMLSKSALTRSVSHEKRDRFPATIRATPGWPPTRALV